MTDLTLEEAKARIHDELEILGQVDAAAAEYGLIRAPQLSGARVQQERDIRYFASYVASRFSEPEHKVLSPAQVELINELMGAAYARDELARFGTGLDILDDDTAFSTPVFLSFRGHIMRDVFSTQIRPWTEGKAETWLEIYHSVGKLISKAASSRSLTGWQGAWASVYCRKLEVYAAAHERPYVRVRGDDGEFAAPRLQADLQAMTTFPGTMPDQAQFLKEKGLGAVWRILSLMRQILPPLQQLLEAGGYKEPPGTLWSPSGLPVQFEVDLMRWLCWILTDNEPVSPEQISLVQAVTGSDMLKPQIAAIGATTGPFFDRVRRPYPHRSQPGCFSTLSYACELLSGRSLQAAERARRQLYLTFAALGMTLVQLSAGMNTPRARRVLAFLRDTKVPDAAADGGRPGAR